MAFASSYVAATKYRRMLEMLLVFGATVVFLWFGNGLNPLWPLMWFAPLPVLFFALRSSWRSTALMATLCWLVGCFNYWKYFHLLETPFTVWLIVFGIAALVFALAVLRFRALALRGAWWGSLLAFPAIWVSYEYARNLLTPHGTAGCIAYSQLNFLPFLQLASITGPWGMGFLLFLFPAAAALGLHLRQSHPKQAFRIFGGSVGLIALVLVFGAMRLAIPQPHQEVRVGLIASDQPGNTNVADAGAETERLFRDYAAEVKKLASGGARVIVLPEKLGVTVDSGTAAADAIFQHLADEANATIVVGQVHVSEHLKYNQARVYAPRVAVLSYDKHHMLPPFESNLKPGTTLTLMPKHAETWGVAICKDMDFTPLSRKYGHAGAGLMLVPAWDFNLDRWWHGHIAVMRGVEDGFTVARAAKDGYLTVSDNRGRIVAETRSDSAPFATLVAEAPAAHAATIYLQLGDWFAWLSVAVFVITTVELFRLRKASSLRRDAVMPPETAKIRN